MFEQDHCPTCGGLITVAKGHESAWITCPVCQTRVLHLPPQPPDWTRRLGCWLGLMGGLLLVPGCPLTLLALTAVALGVFFLGRTGAEEWVLLGCAVVMTVVGVILIRVAERYPQLRRGSGTLFVVLAICSFFAFGCALVALATFLKLINPAGFDRVPVQRP